MGDLCLVYLIGEKADRVLDAFRFEVLEHARLSKGGVATKGDAFRQMLNPAGYIAELGTSVGISTFSAMNVVHIRHCSGGMSP